MLCHFFTLKTNKLKQYEKKLFEHKDYEISSLGMFCFGGFFAQDSNLYAQPASGCKLASQTVILPCTEVANLNGLVIPSNFFKEACNGGTVLSVTTKTSDTGASYADVKGIIRSVDPDAPNIEWEILLPMKWNGRSLQLGGGANNGSIPNVHGTSAFGS